jgi:hypothetical protein
MRDPKRCRKTLLVLASTIVQASAILLKLKEQRTKAHMNKKPCLQKPNINHI